MHSAFLACICMSLDQASTLSLPHILGLPYLKGLFNLVNLRLILCQPVEKGRLCLDWVFEHQRKDRRPGEDTQHVAFGTFV